MLAGLPPTPARRAPSRSAAMIGLLLPSARGLATLPTLPPLAAGSKRLYLARHGETDWNLSKRMQGRSIDEPLNSNGLAQARALADVLAKEPLELVVSSPLRRAARTAELVHEGHAGAAWRLEPRFEEMCFGEFEGKTLDQFEAAFASTLDAWARGELNERWPGAGGESCQDVANRALAGLRDALAGDSRHVLAVAHSRVNKSLIAALRGDLRRCSDVQQGNACVNVLDVDEEGEAAVVLLDYRGHTDGAAWS